MGKKKNKNKSLIEIKDIKTFKEIEHLRFIVNSKYDGKMPSDIYNQFLERITNRYIKDFFIRQFNDNSNINNNIKNNKTYTADLTTEIYALQKQAKPNNLINSYRNIITVSATDFSFRNSSKGLKLVYKEYEKFL